MAKNRVGWLVIRALCCWCLLLAAAGCSRTRYRLAADRDAAGLLAEKSAARPWQVSPAFSVYPHPQSRFFDPTPSDDPLLPVPAPRLYAYSLPDLPERDPNRFGGQASTPGAIADAGPAEPRISDQVAGTPERPPGTASPPAAREAPVRQVAFQTPPADTAQDITSVDLEQLALILGVEVEELRILPIPPAIWESLPERCLRRMFEFPSVREEYRRTFDREPDESLRDPSQRLSLEDIVELALINSREYQAQKERLYATALALSLERFDYDLKFATTGHRTSVNFLDGPTNPGRRSTLGIPTDFRVDQTLATGGTFLASFANDVVLAFNGTDGFSVGVGSTLLFDISQRIFQRDFLLENLTQAERNVVYAARDFARFRKTLFRSLAVRYYGLLLTYRAIEIVSQDYFSNLRGFNQGEAEYRAGRLPRFQVDQFEQSTLFSRSDLIRECNRLEESLDQLKIDIGLPPELPLNLDLTELDQLTLRDEATAVAERVRRSRRNLINERGLIRPERGALLNASVDLVRKMLLVEQLQRRLGEESPQIKPLQLELAQLAAAEADLDVQFNREILAQDQKTEPAAPPLRIFRRTTDLVNSLLVLVSRQLRVADMCGVDSAPLNLLQERAEALRARNNQLQTDFDALLAKRDFKEVIARNDLQRIPEFVQMAADLLTETDALANQLQAIQPPRVVDPDTALQQTLADADRLIAESQDLIAHRAGGLTPLEVDMDEAMLTALTLRYQLMNERERLADDWRRIKYQGDELRSVLNLHASQLIPTRSEYNRPFDFTWDTAETRLAVTFDAPLNRRAQRNRFRQSLIDYNVGLRALMRAEDDVKLEIRDRLRNLALAQEQYQIAVASAALAYERRISTRLQLRLGVNNIRVEDVLDAQRAYTESLQNLAGQHINYILARIGLFLDLELLEVDESGFWQQLYDEGYQPTPNLHVPDYALPIYGQLPHGVWPSHKIKRMLDVPPGQTMIYRTDDSEDTWSEEIPAPPPEDGPAAGE